MEAFGAFGAPLQDIINGYVYGDVWSRRGLGLRERSLVMVAMTAALNRPNELRVHVQGAVKNRCTPASRKSGEKRPAIRSSRGIAPDMTT